MTSILQDWRHGSFFSGEEPRSAEVLVKDRGSMELL